MCGTDVKRTAMLTGFRATIYIFMQRTTARLGLAIVPLCHGTGAPFKNENKKFLK